jgi:hypothetical protein
MTEGLADNNSHGFNNVAIGNLEEIQTRCILSAINCRFPIVYRFNPNVRVTPKLIQ